MPYQFHRGILDVQIKEGTVEQSANAAEAGWIGKVVSSTAYSQIADPDLNEVYLASVDKDGLVWASVVEGDMPGLISFTEPTNDAQPWKVNLGSGKRGFLTFKGDPLEDNIIAQPEAPVGMLIMGYRNRRRYRINGRVASTSVGTAPASASAVGPSSGTASHNVEGDACAISDMIFNVDMAMGNCPKYLHIRDLLKEEQAPRSPIIKRSATLSIEQQALIASSTTFIIGTDASGKGGTADASNRGGNPGFVQALDDRTIVFPDYKGNNLYLSLGNITRNPKAGLLFIKRDTGDVLQVSGEAHIVYETEEGNTPIDLGASTGKHVRINILAVQEAKGANPLRMRMKELSPFNPAIPIHKRSRLTASDGVAGGASSSEHLMQCVEVVDVAAGIKSFRFQPHRRERTCTAGKPCSDDADGYEEKGKLLSWTPGQFATFFFPISDERSRRTSAEKMYTLPPLASPEGERQAKKGGDDPVVRSWTITSVHGDDSPLEITVQAKEGGVSQEIHASLRPGDLVRVAAGGDFTLTARMGAPPDRNSKILLLSAGIGVTPMIAALRWLKQRETARCSDPRRCIAPAFPDVVVFHTARSAETVPYLSEVLQHSGTPMESGGVRFILSTTRPPTVAADSGRNGDHSIDTPGFSTVQGRLDAAMLEREVPDVAERQVFMCGPDAFMAGMDTILRGVGVPSSRIYSEEFSF